MSAHRHTRPWFALLAAALAAAASSTAPAVAQQTAPATGPAPAAPAVTAPTDPAWKGELVFVLDKATPSGRPLTVHLEHAGGRWTDTWATALNYNASLHNVRVTAASLSGDTLSLQLAVEFRRDFWVKGGTGEYEVTLKRNPAENPVVSHYGRLRSRVARAVFSGTFSGHFAPTPPPPKTAFGNPVPEEDPVPGPVQGRVEGILAPAREPRPGHALPALDEHPRLLFREADVPALKRKIETTPLGQAVVAELDACDHEVAEALVYKLTGRPEKARAALERVKTLMKDENNAKTKGYGGIESEHVADFPVGHQAAAAYCYDLCRDAWNAPEKRELDKWARYMVDTGLLKPWSYSNKGSTASPASPTGRLVWSGAAILALNMWGARSPAPPEPRVNPFEERMAQSDPVAAENNKRNLARARDLWQVQMEAWKAANGMDLHVLNLNQIARRGLAVAVHEQVGEGGTLTHRTLLDALIAYRNVFGMDVTGREELLHAAILPLMRTGSWNRTTPIGTDGPVQVDPATLARLLVLARPELRPAIQQYWLRMVGMTMDDLATVAGAREFIRRSFPVTGKGTEEPWCMLYTLQYFDTTATGEPKLPRVWALSARGEYIFRAGTIDQPTLISIDANTSSAGGPTLSAGSFELFAFNRRWTASTPWGSELRGRHNVLYVPGLQNGHHALGSVIFRDTDPETGRGQLTVDCTPTLKEVIEEEISTIEQVKVGDVLTPRTVVRTERKVKDLGLRHARAFAVDFSGKSGAPALLAVADKWQGNARQMWMLQLPDLAPPARPNPRSPWSPPFEVKTHADGFTLARGDETIRATFVSPKGVKVEHVTQKVTAEMHHHGTRSKARGMQDFRRTGIEVTPADGAPADFLVIFTVQKGPAPEVKATGTGLDATVTVGRQKVTFDGTKLLITGP